jgi:hypothetical protein
LVDTQIPEKNDGGVLVHPKEMLDGPMCRTEFIAKYFQAFTTENQG